jgi:hypothetical protein
MNPKKLTSLLFVLTAVYFLASLGHFTHNAEFICEYPKLPAWLTRTQVYATWAAITSVGLLGFLFVRKQFMAPGLLLVAVYAAFGFDGLGHYVVAPMALHTLGANVTILSEVFSAALLLALTVFLFIRQVTKGAPHILSGDAYPVISR